MPLLIAQWPDNTISVLRAPSGWDDTWLFDTLDAESDPHCAKVYVVRGEDAHIGWTKGKVDGCETLEPFCYDGSLKKWEWPSDVAVKTYAIWKSRAPEPGDGK